MANKYSQEDLEEDLMALEEMINHDGGAESEREPARHFKVVQLNGKEVDFGSARIPYLTKPTSRGSGGNPITDAPLKAAKRLLRSIAELEGYSGKDKLKMKPVTYLIKETTREKKVKKIYGPYIGHYKDLTNNEKKTAVRKPEDGKKEIPFTMKAVVHLKKDGKHEDKHDDKHHSKEEHKNKKHHHKGGFNL